MKKKILLGTGALMVVLVGVGMMFRDTLLLAVMSLTLAPGHAFSEASPPQAPDYNDPDHWAALPHRDDWSDRVPVGDFADMQDTAAVDVFFLHPTTYLSSDGWNQSLEDTATNQMTDEFVMQGQASVFNGCCRIYAPRYRQATLYAFLDTTESGPQALDLAYGDVLAAFRYYLTHFNDGRPFVLAGHSQGSRHADYLMAEEIAGTQLADRLVAAYPVGFQIDGSNDVPVCKTVRQTGCQVTWNSVGPAVGSFLASPDNICVNPLTWEADGTAADHNANAGAVSFDAGGVPEPAVADAHCRDGRLWVSDIRSDNYTQRPLGRDNYHIYDYALFYVNVRDNVDARVNAFLADWPRVPASRPAPVQP